MNISGGCFLNPVLPAVPLRVYPMSDFVVIYRGTSFKERTTSLGLVLVLVKSKLGVASAHQWQSPDGRYSRLVTGQRHPHCSTIISGNYVLCIYYSDNNRIIECYGAIRGRLALNLNRTAATLLSPTNRIRPSTRPRGWPAVRCRACGQSQPAMADLGPAPDDHSQGRCHTRPLPSSRYFGLVVATLGQHPCNINLVSFFFPFLSIFCRYPGCIARCLLCASLCVGSWIDWNYWLVPTFPLPTATSLLLLLLLPVGPPLLSR
jgi:hypothetical protein